MRKILVLFTMALGTIILFACDSQVDFSYELYPGNDTVEVYDTWNDSGAIFYIDDIEYIPEVTNNVNTEELGIYTITYSYIHEDEMYEATREVVVADQTAPIIYLVSGLDTIKVGNTWEDAGVDVIDNYDENVNYSIDHDIDTSTPGRYEVSYTAIDSSGNEASIIRIVTVIE